MLYANLHIDLPSERTLRKLTVLEWLSQLIGREVDPRGEHELSTVTGLAVFRPVTLALEQFGITDVLSVIIDGRAAYVDTDEHSGDLATAVAELDAHAALAEGFESMSMVLSVRRHGLRVLCEVTLRRRVPADSPELLVRLAARIDAMQIRSGEHPDGYAARLRALIADAPALDAARSAFTALATELETKLAAQLGPLCVSSSVSPVTIRLIRPGPRQLDHFRRLHWGANVRMPSYRPVPIVNRRGAYDEPFYHHYYDPYFDFVAWVTITEIVAGRGLQGLAFEIVDPEGARVFGSDDALGEAAFGGHYEGLSNQEPVRVTDSALLVDPAVPVFTGPDPGELAAPHLAPGFAGDGSDGGGWADAGVAGPGGGGGVGGGELGGCGASCGGCGSG